MTELALLERAGLPAAARQQRAIADAQLEGSIVMWTEARRPILRSVLVVLVFFVGFVGWATFASLESAVIARGQISPEGSRRIVQHFEGGIISRLRVRDGDVVQAGAVLVELNDTQADATYKVYEGRMRAQKAVLARLQAEQAGAEGITFPPEVLDTKGDPALQQVMADQTNLFEVRRDAIAAQRNILGQQVAQLREQIAGLNDQISSTSRQRELIQSETNDVQSLIDKGLERRARVLSLQRAAAALDGQKAATQATVAQAQQKISEIQMQIATLDTTRLNEVNDQIAKVQTELDQLGEQVRAQNEVRQRTQITAPVAGTVVGMRFKSEGGVIRPGEAVLDIVPRDDDLLIDARISPMDIDAVRMGQEAEVLFSSYRVKFLPRIMGDVTYVSADSISDPRTGVETYEVKVRVRPEERALLDQMDPPVKLVAGMPAEVFVVTGDATVMGYLLNPLVELVRRTFRESNGL